MKIVSPNKLLEATRGCLICFAHYGDGEFIGFHADTYGTISKEYPKIYENSERQIEIIETNYKTRINSMRLMREKQRNYKHELSKYKDIELKVVLCEGLNDIYPTKEQIDKWLKKPFKTIYTIKS